MHNVDGENFIFLRMSSFLKLNMDLFHELLKQMLM